jgi:signal transduction histidine kinase
VTHELKTPLALIKAVSETLEFGRYTAENRIDEYGKLLRAEATRLTLRIDNLLAYARSTERGDAYQPEVVDLLDVIHESLHRAEPRLAAFELDANLAEAPLVSGDKGALLHVFDNLIDNAIKYSAERKRISVHTETADGMAVITIADQGIGITADDRGRVFEKFFRGRSGRSGSGLGLAIAERVVRAHGGTISIASEVGQGTTVTVRLPPTNPV